MTHPARTAAVVALVLVVAGFVALMAWGLQNRTPSTGKSGVSRVGKPAPDFTLPSFDGGDFTLSERRGRATVINFWASWCAPCRVEAPVLEAAWQSYKDRGVLFLGVQTQDAEGDGRAFLREFGLTYPNVIDAQGEVTVRYGVSGLPVTFLVDEDGVVLRRWVGDMSAVRLASWLDELVPTPAGG